MKLFFTSNVKMLHMFNFMGQKCLICWTMSEKQTLQTLSNKVHHSTPRLSLSMCLDKWRQKCSSPFSVTVKTNMLRHWSIFLISGILMSYVLLFDNIDSLHSYFTMKYVGLLMFHEPAFLTKYLLWLLIHVFLTW